MLDFLPPGHPWHTELLKQGKKVPVLKWWEDMGDKYLKTTRSEILIIQNRFNTYRWTADIPVQVYVEKLREVYDQHCFMNDMTAS